MSAGYWRQHGSRLLVRGTPSGCSSGLCTIVDVTSGQHRLEGTLPGRWLAVDGSETGDLIYGVNEIGELLIGRRGPAPERSHWCYNGANLLPVGGVLCP